MFSDPAPPAAGASEVLISIPEMAAQAIASSPPAPSGHADLTVLTRWYGGDALVALAESMARQASGLRLQLLVADLAAPGLPRPELPAGSQIMVTWLPVPGRDRTHASEHAVLAGTLLAASRWVLVLPAGAVLCAGAIEDMLRLSEGQVWVREAGGTASTSLDGLLIDVTAAGPNLYRTAFPQGAFAAWAEVMTQAPGRHSSHRWFERGATDEAGPGQTSPARWRPPPVCSVVIPTVCRPTLIRSIESLLAQVHDGHLEILVGVDRDLTGQSALLQAQIRARLTPSVALHWIELPYSTSVRHGGINPCRFGGTLRSALSWLASADRIVYLDDDDWLAPSHVADVVRAANGKSWSYGLCHYADGEKGTAYGVDTIESVGPGRGVFKKRFGGFVRSSGLLIDRRAAPQVIHRWSVPFSSRGDGEDRMVFDLLRRLPGGFTGRASVYYALNADDEMHKVRVEFLGKQGVTVASSIQRGSYLRPQAAA